jgi:hypothetical protein
VDRFVISVARDRGGEPNATITVEVSEGRAFATELNVRAGKGGAVDRASLPVVDILMQALSTDETPAPRAAATRQRATRVAAAESADVAVAEAPVAAPARRARAKKAAAPARKRGRPRAAASTTGGRAYRRMPEPDAVMAAYQEVGTITGLADHFGVPQHTVKGWANRLRQMGYEFAR